MRTVGGAGGTVSQGAAAARSAARLRKAGGRCGVPLRLRGSPAGRAVCTPPAEPARGNLRALISRRGVTEVPPRAGGQGQSLVYLCAWLWSRVIIKPNVSQKRKK